MSKPSKLVGDCLYQVNLVLWMLQPASAVGVRPVFHDAGYRLHSIEPELMLDVELASRLMLDEIAASNPVVPDLLLDSPEQEYLLLECKRSMFGAETEGGDSALKQARSLLLQTPPRLASALAAQSQDIRTTSLLYLTRHDSSHAQAEGLCSISQQLQARGYRTTAIGLLGLEAAPGAILLRHDYPQATTPDRLRARLGTEPIVVQDLEEGTDPRPLYFIPWMPGANDSDDDYSQAAFGNRILAEATSVLAQQRPPCTVELDVDALLGRATFGLRDRWRNKAVLRQLRDRTRELLRGQIRQGAAQLNVRLLSSPRHGLVFDLPDTTTQKRIIEAFRKWQTERWNVPIIQPGLFDSLEDNG